MRDVMLNADVDDAYLHTLPLIAVADIAAPFTAITVAESPVLPISVFGADVKPIALGIVSDHVE